MKLNLLSRWRSLCTGARYLANVVIMPVGVSLAQQRSFPALLEFIRIGFTAQVSAWLHRQSPMELMDLSFLLPFFPQQW